MLNEYTLWFIFAAVIAVMFFVDLYVTDHRRGKITLRASLIWSGIWIITALLFNAFIYFYLENGHVKAIEFLTGYLIEKSLSVDNLFVFLMIFKVMDVPLENQPHVLKWGILSAIVFRIIFIIAGVGLIRLFHPVIYIFGIILLYAAYKMAFADESKQIDPNKNVLLRFAQKYLNFKPGYHGNHFFISKDNKIYATTMFLTFLLIESSDIVFAVDSIPAVIAITKDEFIIITSNIFAILGLRALYFALAEVVDLFVYLKYGVAIVLFYVGIKMIISEFFLIPTVFSLSVIVIVLGGSIALSMMKKKRKVHRQSESKPRRKGRRS